jgi:GntR family transcriptional regulator
MGNMGNSGYGSQVIYVRHVTIDHYSEVPLYRQLAAVIRARIESGELARLDPLPSESTLEQEFGLGRDSVRKALAVLREEGLIFTIQARGSFVGPPPG